MIKIKLNDYNYRYDIYQIVNLFYDFETIKFDDNDFDYIAEISQDKFIFGDKVMKTETKFGPVLSRKEQVKLLVFQYFSLLTGKKLPWGTLIGIRPTKIALSLLQEGKDKKQIEEYFESHNRASKEKADLCVRVAQWERNRVNKETRNISVYLGMPFCPTRCLYCSFASNPIGKLNKIVDPYLKAMLYEMDKMSEFINDKKLNIESVYFGGGTPTAINNEQFKFVMENINKYFINSSVKEFTVECGRPDSVNEEKLRTMKKNGVTRISINPQTMNDETLKRIGRAHSVQDIIEKYYLARSLKFDNINMDLIVGLPGENYSHIENTCKQILKLRPDNLTIHGLCIKRGSRLFEDLLNHHDFEKCSQDELNRMYDATLKLSEDLEMHPYYMYRQKNMSGNMENVGYSIPNKESIYNVQMIEERQTIIAIGADAVTKVVFMEENRIERCANLKDVKEYVDRIEEKCNEKIKLLSSLY